ncbi:hypothetical protein DACRYDRAFT_119201 [Dacryopinax primogenitus]|uniref:Zn(2)-C6 fungal-type domain-containing protein n=1 Tax=Dacryopinax primogenitus (strain DJM 731) TaxID=1858805 RepID=M5G152_DACPD|nr:uncharacterized protein DACRYDRAFT_119201 [Dacryopinax primogenitus]EJT97502.1 hypothetical protein DACRYDRAFT_119201 [Dacryopinax primogenitus]
MPADRRRKSMIPDDGEHRPMSSTRLSRLFSCLACRQRKVKCDSGKPLCGNCIQAGASECVYKERQKPGLKPGIGTALVDRVAALESAMLHQASRVDKIYGLLDQKLTPPPSIASPALPSSTLDSHVSPPAPYLAAVTPVPSMPSHPMDISHSVMEIPHVEPTPTYAQNHVTPGMVDNRMSHESPVSTSSFVDNADLPPNDLVAHLIDLYFNHVAPFAPFLLRDHSYVHQDTDMNGTIPRGWPVTVYAMVAVSLRFSFDPRWQMPGFLTKEQYYKAAKQRVVMHAIESTSFQSLQALAIIALDTIGTGAGPSAWGVLALLTRSVMHLGLQSEEDPGAQSRVAPLSRVSLLKSPKNFREEEGRRRLFWVIYVLDRWASVSTGWDFALSDQQISRNLPCREDFWLSDSRVVTREFRSPLFDDGLMHQEEFLDPLAYLVEIADLLGRVHQLHRHPLNPTSEVEVTHFYERTRTLDAAVRRWYCRLPPEISSPARIDSHPMIVLVQAMYHATLIKLQSIVAHPPDLSSYMQPNAEAGQHIVQSAKQVALLARAVTQTGLKIPHTSPFLAWCMWVAGRVIFMEAYHGAEPVDGDIHEIVQALEMSGRYWDVARRYASLLKKAIDKMQDHNPFGAVATQSRSRATAISALLDLRRTAFGADLAVPTSGTQTPANPVSVQQPNDDYTKILDGMLATWADQQNVLDLQWFEMPNVVM